MAGGGVRGVAGIYVVLGISVACFALYAMSIARSNRVFQQLQIQMIKEAGMGHQPEEGQISCAATAAEAMQLRTDVVVLLLFGAAQALVAMAAIAATSHFFTFLATLLSIPVAWRLYVVFAGAVHVAIGRCQDHGAILTGGYLGVAMALGLLFMAGFVGVFSGKAHG